MSRPATACSDTRQHLLEAAALCFAEKGFEGTGTRDIAERAGKPLSSIAYHFSTKEALYAETFRFLFDRYPKAPLPEGIDSLEALEGNPELAEQALRAHVRSLFKDLEHGRRDPLRRALIRLYIAEMQEPRPVLHDLYRDRLRTSVNHLRACLRALRPDLTPQEIDLLGRCLQGQCFIHYLAAGVHALVWDGQEVPPTPDFADRIADLALDGIRPRQESR